MHPALEQSHRDFCADNLRRILSDALDHDGAYPPDLITFVTHQSHGCELVVCPGGADSRATNAAQIAEPGYCSYIYVGAGLTTKSNPNCVIALEDPANHDLDGGNLLFADGRIEFHDLPLVIAVLIDLNAGKNPPSTQPTTMSISAAKQAYRATWQPRMPQLKTSVWHIPAAATRPTGNTKGDVSS